MSSNFQVILRPVQAQKFVSEQLDQEIKRTAFYNWRKYLGLAKAPYTLEDCYAIVHFGHWVKAGATFETAKKRTIEYLRSQAS